MQRVIVTVKHQAKAQSRDLEVPADVESKQLVKMIAEALHWGGSSTDQPAEYEIRADPPGRVLSPGETLAQAGAWDGACLVFQRAGSNATVHSPDSSSSLKSCGDRGPVTGWRSLDIDLSGESESEPEETPSDEIGFAWKQLD